jgi:hypothetical protein
LFCRGGLSQGFLLAGVFPLTLIPDLHRRPILVTLHLLPACLHSHGLCVCCTSSPSVVLLLLRTCTASHTTAPTSCSLPFATHHLAVDAYDSPKTTAQRSYSSRKLLTISLGLHTRQLTNAISRSTEPSQPDMDVVYRFFCKFYRVGRLEGMVLPYSVFLVLGAAAPARAVKTQLSIWSACLSTSVLICQEVYESRLWLHIPMHSQV